MHIILLFIRRINVMINRDEIMELFDKHKEETDERVKAGIELNRKGYFKINVCDENGIPVKGVKIKADLKNHEFKFGANLFMLDELESDEKNEKYREYFKDVFNMATIPFYWDALEPEKGKQRYDKNSPKIYRRPAPDLCLEFCEKYGIEPREHALAYDKFFPKWLEGKSTHEVKYELSRRMKEIGERYSDKFRTMEVTNETYWPYGSKSVTDFYEDNEFVEWCFKEAEKYMSANELSINEAMQVWKDQGRNRDAYYMQIERAFSKGARIDAIGMQYHMFQRAEEAVEKTRIFYDPTRLFRILDKYAELKKPLQITEVTIPAYTYEAEDEELQAEIMRTLYSIWFSHKNMEQIVYWNLVDGYAAFAPQGDMEKGENYYRGGLIRFDFTKKPAYNMLKNLIKKEWHTTSDFVSDQDGNAEFKGFYGIYTLDIEKDGKKITKEINFNKDHVGNFKITL